MGTIGSFGTFTTARLAIYVSQKGLSVTGNNIANINTIGYTRQRVDQVSFKTGMADRYQNPFDKHVGNGAIAQSISQLRDPYLDIRYRAEHSSEGFYTGKLNGLKQIADILDEIGKGENDGDGLLYGQFSDFFDAIQHVQVGAGTQVNDTLASTSAEKLCQLFYSNANRLEILKNNTEVQLRQEIDSINSKLVSIREYNEAIQQAEIFGDAALELRDARNLLIDELSEKLKINATYSMVNIGGKEVEKLTIRLGDANPDTDVYSDSSLLVDGDYCAQLTTPQDNKDYDPDYALFDKNSTAYEQAVKDLKAGKPVKDPRAPDGNTTFADVPALEAAIKDFFQDPANAMKPYAYLDPNGEGTNDPRVAKQVFDKDYNITVSDLRDENNKAWETKPAIIDSIVKDTTGFPTKAKYIGQFTFSGVWKDGDKIDIEINGKPITVEVGKDLSADDANENAKNVSNAIRKAMMDSGAFDDYDIKTQTIKTADGYNVQLTVKAKEPGKKADLPEFAISATTDALPAGAAKIDTATADADRKGRFTAEVTVDEAKPFHTGEKITIGTGADAITLEVGKDIGVKTANDPAKLAARLAAKLGQSEKFKGFNVSSTTDKDGKAFLVFQGAEDAKAPEAADLGLTVTEATPVTFTGPTVTDVDWTNGEPATPAVEKLMTAPPDTVDNGDNTTSRVLTRYYMDDNDQWHKFVRTTTTSNTKMLDDNDLYGKLQSVRELLTEEGEFASAEDIKRDESAAIKRGIPFYQQTLDLLARQFATVMNEANNGFAVDENGNYLTSNDGGKTFTQLDNLAGAPLNKNTELTDDQKDAVEAVALENYVKANFAGFVKDADGNDTNVLADKYGNPLAPGGVELTTANLTFTDEKGDPVTAPTSDPINFASVAYNGTVPDEVTAALNKDALDNYLAVNGGYKMGGNLFSNRGDTDDDTGITAKNISVSTSWSHDDVHVVPTYIKLFMGEGTNTTQQDNALHMGNLLNRDLNYNPQDLMGDAVSTELFVGSFQELLEQMNVTQGNDQGLTELALATHAGQALDIDTSRDSVSAVDLNDEAMNLMTYTHSLNAAYRLMTTVDEMIERLITGTGVTR